jgi:hypothetical protein
LPTNPLCQTLRSRIHITRWSHESPRTAAPGFSKQIDVFSTSFFPPALCLRYPQSSRIPPASQRVNVTQYGLVASKTCRGLGGTLWSGRLRCRRRSLAAAPEPEEQEHQEDEENPHERIKSQVESHHQSPT